MKKLPRVLIISAGLLLLGIVGAGANNQPANLDTVKSTKTSPVTENITEKVKPTCDGTVVSSSCTLDGVNYKTYTYHPAIPEKNHVETVTTFKEEIVSYCTLCNDDTFSPSCATGRGACSHHGGVAQWNAPRYGNVPSNNTKTVVDAPYQEAYYEKILE